MIDYKVRTSSRSRQVRLSVSHHSGVVIVVPSGFDSARIPDIIAKKERWIRRSIEKVQWTGEPVEIPTQINLKSVGTRITVIVEEISKRESCMVEEEDRLRLRLRRDLRSKRVPFTLLKKWLRQKGIGILLPWLERVSKEHGFIYHRSAIRSQRTRWGSCSIKKNINLNQVLLFLRPELVEYLMIHELCHTVHMNHSKNFWELVGTHCPDYRALDKELRSARKNVERWVY